MAVIPGGLTKKLQLLDLTVNKSFKSKMLQRWEKWMLEGIHTFTKSGIMKRASYSVVCNWIVDSWKEITVECIKNGFRRAGLCNYNESNLEDSDDTIIYEEDDNDSDKENSGMTEVMAFKSSLGKYSEILEAFNIDSDEDFDGF
jgi:hypothetical protein